MLANTTMMVPCALFILIAIVPGVVSKLFLFLCLSRAVSTHIALVHDPTNSVTDTRRCFVVSAEPFILRAGPARSRTFFATY